MRSADATFWRGIVERQVRAAVRNITIMGQPAYSSDEQRESAVTEIMRRYEEERDRDEDNLAEV
jgi:hypothetical protein